MSDSTERELTFGEKAVGLTFNHGEGEIFNRIQEVKTQYAAIIDGLDAQRKTVSNPSEKGALLTLAIREAQTAQMWAVKAITWAA